MYVDKDAAAVSCRVDDYSDTMFCLDTFPPPLQARRSVSDADLQKYSSFATTLQQQRSAMNSGAGVSNFRFPAQYVGPHAAHIRYAVPPPQT